jgi:Spa2 homology domain (SHD) of GIT
MKRSTTSTRAPSPTNTTFSGISNYRTESYKPLRDKSSTSSPPLEPRLIARIHYEELSKYLVSYLAKGPILFFLITSANPSLIHFLERANSRSTARQKLTRLTRQQFQELSTDVYDELTRRKAETNQRSSLSSFRCRNSPPNLSPLPPRPRGVSSKTKSSSSEACHPPNKPIPRSVQRCVL